MYKWFNTVTFSYYTLSLHSEGRKIDSDNTYLHSILIIYY